MKAIFALCLLVASAAALPKKAHRLTDRRIVGGQDANPGQFPHQISFQYSGSHICGGSVLDENTIVTAAHCCDVFSGPSQASIVAGDHSLGGNDGTEQPSDVKEIRQNEDFSGWTLENDICLLILDSSLDLSADEVNPIGLPESMAEPSEGDILIASGWGTTSSGGSLPDILQWVEIPYVTDDECNSLIGGVSDSMICAGNVQDGGVDTCQGDSGGPLTTADSSTLVGLTSWGYGCADPRSPGVYTQVSYFLDWIEANRG